MEFGSRLNLLELWSTVNRENISHHFDAFVHTSDCFRYVRITEVEKKKLTFCPWLVIKLIKIKILNANYLWFLNKQKNDVFFCI